MNRARFKKAGSIVLVLVFGFTLGLALPTYFVLKRIGDSELERLLAKYEVLTDSSSDANGGKTAKVDWNMRETLETANVARSTVPKIDRTTYGEPKTLASISYSHDVEYYEPWYWIFWRLIVLTATSLAIWKLWKASFEQARQAIPANSSGFK